MRGRVRVELKPAPTGPIATPNLEEKGALQGFLDENKDLSIEHSTLQTHTIPYNDKPNPRFIPK